jgi:hypothetical protein
MYTFNGNLNQKWFLHPVDQQYYKIETALVSKSGEKNERLVIEV